MSPRRGRRRRDEGEAEDPHHGPPTEEWLVGFRIGLVLAEQCMGEIMKEGGSIEVLNADREVIFSSRISDLLALADGERNQPQ
jgi:hypothetical protein